MFTLTRSIQHYTEGSSQYNEATKRNEKTYVLEDIKCSSFEDNIAINGKNSMDSIQKVL